MIIKRTSITRGLKLFIYNLISFIFQFGFSEENGCSAWLVLLTVIWIFYFVYIFLTYPTHCKKKIQFLKFLGGLISQNFGKTLYWVKIFILKLIREY